MKKALAVLIALLSAFVLFLPFDLPPFPFFFIDEAIALVLLTKSLAYLGIDITRFLPFVKSHSRRASSTTPPPARPPDFPSSGPTIDV